MTKYSPATMVVAEGLSMKKQGKTYHYYYRINGKAYRKSTKTGDTRRARKIALDAFEKTKYETDNGIISETVSFNLLCKKFLATMQHQLMHTFYESTLRNHFKPFFGKFVDVSRIKLLHIDDYSSYRINKVKKVSNATLNKKRTVFNKLFAYAKKHDFIQNEIALERFKQENVARPHFEVEQYKLLLQTSKQRMKEVQPANLKGQRKGLLRTSLWSRQLLHDLIVFMVDTGLRPCELASLKWSQIDIEEKSVKLHRAGKMKSSRRLLVRTAEGIKALNRLKQRRSDYIEEHGGQFSPQEYLQSYPNAQRVRSLRKGFNQLMHECGFTYESDALSHVFYSLRHTYATYALAGIRGRVVPIRGVALQMGTSVRMIEEHYGHDKTTDYASFLVN